MITEKMIDEWIEAYREEMIEELMEWVRHPSVSRADLAAPNAPYGPNCRRMLDFALKRCSEFGFRTEDHEGYCGSVYYGEAAEEIGLYAHLDVVPEGENWIYSPYEPVVKEGFVIGRGANDNKAAAIMGLFLLRFFKEHSLEPKKKIRLMFGCAEETGMDDFRSYLASGGKVPPFGIVADGGFPVCFAQKGSWNADILVPKGADLLEFKAGNVRNAVPGTAEMLVKADAERAEEALREYLENAPQDAGKVRIETGEIPGTVRLFASGKAGHAAFPSGSDNAAIRLARTADTALSPLGIDIAGLSFIVDTFEKTDGSGMGFACADEASGELTSNAGVFSTEGENIRVLLDIRYPVTAKIGEMTEAFKAKLEKEGVKLASLDVERPFCMDPKDERIVLLQQIYRDLTGDEREPYSMGGGTYSRVIPGALTFGPGMAHDMPDFLPEGHGDCHGPDETQHIGAMMKAFKIYLLSFIKLTEAE